MAPLLALHWAITAVLYGVMLVPCLFLFHCLWVLFQNRNHPLIHKRHTDMVAAMVGSAFVFTFICDLGVRILVGKRGFHARDLPYESFVEKAKFKNLQDEGTVYLWGRAIILEVRSLILMIILEAFISRLWLIYFNCKWLNIIDDSKWISIICANHYRDKNQAAMDKPCIVTDTFNALKAVTGETKEPAEAATVALTDDPSSRSKEDDTDDDSDDSDDVKNDFFVKYKSTLGSTVWVKRCIPVSIALWWMLDMWMIMSYARYFPFYEAAKIFSCCVCIVGMWYDLPRVRDSLKIWEEMGLLIRIGTVQILIMGLFAIIPLIPDSGSTNWWFLYASKILSYPGFWVFLGIQVLFPVTLLLKEKRRVFGTDWGRKDSLRKSLSLQWVKDESLTERTESLSSHISQSSLDSVKLNSCQIHLSQLVVGFLDHRSRVLERETEKRLNFVQGLLQLANANSESDQPSEVDTPASVITPIGGGNVTSPKAASPKASPLTTPVATSISPDFSPALAPTDATPRMTGKRSSRRLSILALGSTALLNRMSAHSVSASPVGSADRPSRLLTIGGIHLDTAGNRRPIEEVRLETALKGGVKLLLSDKDAVPMFMEHLMSEYSMENLLCLIEFVQFKARFSGNVHKKQKSKNLLDKNTNANEEGGTNQDEKVVTTVREEPWFAVLRDEIAKSDIVWDPCADAYSVAIKLCERYIFSGAEYEINTSYATRTTLIDMLESPDFVQQKLSAYQLATIFNPALSEVLRLMKDSFSRWNRTDSFRRYAQTVQV